MKKLLFLAALAAVMAMTCPPEVRHKDSICLSINRAIDEKFGDSEFSLMGIINYGGKFALKKVAKLLVDSNVTVENYGLLSVGRFSFDGREKVVSVGMFNYIFTLSKDDVLEEIEKQGF